MLNILIAVNIFDLIGPIEKCHCEEIRAMETSSTSVPSLPSPSADEEQQNDINQISKSSPTLDQDDKMSNTGEGKKLVKALLFPAFDSGANHTFAKPSNDSSRVESEEVKGGDRENSDSDKDDDAVRRRREWPEPSAEPDSKPE